MISKAIKILIIVITICMVIFYGLFYTRDALKFVAFRKSGLLGSSIIGEDSKVILAKVDTADFVSRPFPAQGDQLLTINDTVAEIAIINQHFASPHPPGHEVKITYKSKGDTLRTMVRTRPLRRRQVAIQAVLMALRLLISVCFWGVGFWAFVKRPDSSAVRSLTLFCYAMGGFLMTSVSMINDSYTSLSFPLFVLLNNGMSLLAMFLGALWLNLQLLFPAPRDFIKRHPIWTYALCYIPPAAIYLISRISQNKILGILLILLITLQVSVGFFLLSRYHRRTKELIEKRQTRLVLWGTGTGLIGCGLFIMIALVASNWISRLPEIYIMGSLIILFLGLLLSPISFAYAFGKYRLLEIEGRIRRGTRHFLIALILLAIFYLLIYFSSEFMLEVLGIESRTPVLIIALALAIGFAPAQRWHLSVLDKWIYPERFRLKGMLNDFLQQSMVIADKKTFWNELENRLKVALKVEQVYPVLRAAGNGHFEHWTGKLTPFEKDSLFISTISRVGGRPVMRDELEAGGKMSFTIRERDWFNDNQVALILPMVARSELIGFLGIGLKSERQDFEPADFEILQSLGNQIAVATDNIILVEENAEKRRMEAELSIARKVQEGMLPHDIPNTPGLEVAALSRFCTEVAGDYYDVIDVGDGRTVLAIGDVSGKGAGAALLMSNVQASLRMAIGIEAPLPAAEGTATSASNQIKLIEIVANINRLIYRNSQPEQFITFFVALFDPKTGRLDYVNAGHNPPLAIIGAGQIEALTEGGILLGAVPGMTYEQGTKQLASGDAIFLYTDGLSEAIDETDEMFGEKRISQFLLANLNREPQLLLERLEVEVAQFIGRMHLADDFTLLAARVK